MSDPTKSRGNPGPSRWRPGLASGRRSIRGRRPGRRPSVEGLEGRRLMSYGGGNDFSFGDKGLVSYQVAPASEYFVANASVLQGDGKLVVVGSLGKLGPTGTGGTSHLAASRYNGDGSIDPSFGVGGTFQSPSLTTFPTDGYSITDSNGGALQPDGKIVVVGEVAGVVKVVRLTSDGMLDSTFGSGGVVTLGSLPARDGLMDYAGSVAIQPDGKIVLGGYAGQIQKNSPYYLINTTAVERLDADGTPDPTFGQGGLVVVPPPAGTVGQTSFGILASAGLVVQPDGKIVVDGTAELSISNNVALSEILSTRLDVGGKLDPTFGTGGQAIISGKSVLPGAVSSTVMSLAIQPDGKLILGGTILTAEPTSTEGYQHELALRLGTDGRPDPSFGIGGANILPENQGGGSVAAIALQADGKIVLANKYNLGFVRLKADGLQDASFGTDGASYLTYVSGRGDGLVGVSILPDGKILAPQGGTPGSPLQGIVRVLGRGAPGDYDGDGVSDPAIDLTSAGAFAYKASGGGAGAIVPFGTPGAGRTLPTPGAYDGSGVSELAVYLPAQGEFAVRPFFGGPDVITPFGTPGAGNSIPAPGNYDGSDRTEYAVYLPRLGAFAYRPAYGGPDVFVPFGTPGPGKTIPEPADYFGGGRTDVAAYLPDLGAYAIRNPATGRDSIIPFGIAGMGQSIPVPGDYDGASHAELAVYLPTYGALVYRPARGGPDVAELFGIPGPGMTLPAPGDYDGSGKTEVAAYFPTLGLFGFRPADGGKDVLFQFGTAGQTIPFALASATDTGTDDGSGLSASSVRGPVEIPLTSDVLDCISGRSARKAANRS